MLDVLCPTCGNLIRIKSQSEIGQFISCPECQDVFHLASLNPPMLERLDVAWSASESKNGRRDKQSKSRHPGSYDFEDEFDDFPNGKRPKRSKRRGQNREY